MLNTQWWKILGILTLLSIIVLIGSWTQRQRFDEASIAKRSIKNIIELQENIDELARTLESTKPYLTSQQMAVRLSRLARLKEICEENQAFSARLDELDEAKLSASLQEKAQALQQICADIVDISDYAIGLNRAIAPVAKTKPELRGRLVGLPFYERLLRSRQRRASQSTLQALRNLDNSKVNYPYHDQLLLAAESLDFSSAHANLIALQRDFWINYVGLDALSQELTYQQTKLCEHIPNGKFKYCET